MPKSDKFTLGDLVFAKVKGYPPWPARIISIPSKDRYKCYFYGTYETASLKNEDIWIYNAQNKDKFAPKNMKRKGYTEGMDQLENNPELAGIEDDVPLSDLKTLAPAAANTPTNKNKKSATTTSSKDNTPKSILKDTPEGTGSRGGGEKRKASTSATDGPSESKSLKKSTGDDAKTSRASNKNVSDDSQSEDDKPRGRSGRGNKQNKVESESGSPSPAISTQNKPGRRSRTIGEGKENSSPVKRNVSAETPEQDKANKLEKRKNKLRWLKMEQRLVELDIAVKSSLHLERPSPERCISALEELNELAIVPFMLKKQPDIVTTVRRLRKYIGPHSFNTWADVDAKKRMEKSIDIIQMKADQIYNKFKSYFAYQGEKPFSSMFEEEVAQFKTVTKGMEEGKVLSMIRDPSEEGTISDED